VGAPCFSRGKLDFSPAEKAYAPKSAFPGCGKKPNCCHPESPLGVRDLLFDFAFLGAPACCALRDLAVKSPRRTTAESSEWQHFVFCLQPLQPRALLRHCPDARCVSRAIRWEPPASAGGSWTSVQRKKRAPPKIGFSRGWVCVSSPQKSSPGTKVPLTYDNYNGINERVVRSP